MGEVDAAGWMGRKIQQHEISRVMGVVGGKDKRDLSCFS